MEMINLINEPLNTNLDKKGLKRLIILPDYSPSKGELPVGTVAVYSKEEHTLSYSLLGPDIGCGMLLAKLKNPVTETKKIEAELKSRKSDLRKRLGGGNHFINFYNITKTEYAGAIEEDTVVLVHSGSRLEGQRIYSKKLKGDAYLKDYLEAIEYARRNRLHLLDNIQNILNNEAICLMDLPHNTIEITANEIIYRKGAIRLIPEEYGIISSFKGGKAILIKARTKIIEIEKSMCHGTGRKIARSEAKKIQQTNPYRTLEEIIPRIEEYISVVGELTPQT